jgi:hypothetical protein
MIVGMIPDVADLMPTLVDAVVMFGEYLPLVIEMIPTIVESVAMVVEMIPQVSEIITDVIEVYIPLIVTMLPEIIDMVPTIFEAMETLVEIVPMVYDMVPTILALPEMAVMIAEVLGGLTFTIDDNDGFMIGGFDAILDDPFLLMLVNIILSGVVYGFYENNEIVLYFVDEHAIPGPDNANPYGPGTREPFFATIFALIGGFVPEVAPIVPLLDIQLFYCDGATEITMHITIGGLGDLLGIDGDFEFDLNLALTFGNGYASL